MKKDVFALLLALFVSVTVIHADVISGTCGAEGDNLTWELDDYGNMTIKGSGDMQNYESYAPWHDHYVRSLTVEKGVTSIGRIAFIEAQLEIINLSSTVVRIGEAAFERCGNLTYLQLPENLQIIEFGAFQGDTLLESVGLPNSVDSVGWYAFAQCKALTEPIYNDHLFARLPMSHIGNYTLPDGIVKIAGTAFETCEKLSNIIFSSSVKEIGTMAFSYCSALTTVDLSPSIEIVGSDAFYGCNNLTNAHIGKNVKKILYNPFEYCEQFTTFTLDNENPYFVLENGLLYSNDKTQLILCPTAKRVSFTDLAPTITSVAPGALRYTINVDSVAFPEGVKVLGDRALLGSSVKYIVLPSTLDSIGPYAICIYHQNFQTIVSYAQKPPKSTMLFGAYQTKPDTLYVPYGAGITYRNAEGWGKCPLIVEMDPVPEEPDSVYFVSYIDKDASILDTESITLHLPAPTSFSGFTFLRWDVVAGQLEDGIVLQAVYEADDPTSAPEVYTNPSNRAQKLIRNGNVYILTDDSRTYTVTGQEVK